MVKSLRYEQKGCDNFSNTIDAGRLRRSGHTDADANLNGHPAPDRDTASDGHADARVDLPAAESRGSLDAARSV